MQIFNSIGEAVYANTLTSLSLSDELFINTGSFVQGTYFVIFTFADGSRVTRNFVVNR